MLSVPPARITSAEPHIILSAAKAMDCKPEEQKRFIVIADTSGGNPARRLAMRATFIPCSASGMAQPKITSSISEDLSSGVRWMAFAMTVAAISSGRMSFRVPLLALPTGVLNAVTTTASFIIHLPFGCFSLLLNSYENGRNPSPDRQGGAHRPIASTTPNGRGSVFFLLCGADLGGIGDSVQFLNGFP